MEKDIKKITRVIMHPVRDLQLRFHVSLYKEKNNGTRENFHTVYTVKDENYLKLDFSSFVTMEIVNRQWRKDLSIMITQSNIYQIIFAFKKMLDHIYHGGIFAQTKDGKIIAYKDKVEECAVKAFNIGGNQKLFMTAGVIYDDNDVSYEGVLLFINKTENYVELPIDAFESLYYCLTKLDLIGYSQLLINYYMSSVGNNKVELKQVEIPEGGGSRKRKREVFIEKEEKELVKSNLPEPQSNEEFFGIKNKGDDSGSKT